MFFKGCGFFIWKKRNSNNKNNINNLINMENGKDISDLFTETEDALKIEANKLHRDEHDEIAIKVYKRLRLRYAQLSKGEKEARNLNVQGEITNNNQPQHEIELNNNIDSDKPTEKNNNNLSPNENKNNSNGESTLPPNLRAYHLAVTDLFVEKALAYLESQAGNYKKRGYNAYRIALIIILVGASIALYQMGLFKSSSENLKIIQANYSVLYIISSFTKAFTAYGMIVLVVVGLWRYGKAMLDQSERLMERRHALRQGRLFVHLSDGKLRINELEDAFNWNMTQNNAFADMRTDAQAPWGTVFKEFAHVAPELLKILQELKNKK